MVLIRQFSAQYADYLRDESRMEGSAASISFPSTPDELHELLSSLYASSTPVTVQGGRTGIAGGAVPAGGHVLNLSAMNRITGLRCDEAGTYFLAVEPGVLLTTIEESLRSRAIDTSGWTSESKESLRRLQLDTPWFFTPDPTETTASVGGMINCNASGARSFRYGSIRAYVEGLDLAFADGSAARLRRGEVRARGRAFELSAGGRRLQGAVPGYTAPSVKNAAGYFAQENMDLVDLFVGSEGTLAIVAGAELRLAKQPASVWGVIWFLPDEPSAAALVRTLRGETAASAPALRPSAIEYFDASSLELLRSRKAAGLLGQSIPPIPAGQSCALYAEFAADSGDRVQEGALAASESAGNLGAREDETWLADTARELDKLKLFRHALPEAVNAVIDERRRQEPGLTKLGTDLAVPAEHLDDMLHLYRQDLADARLDSVVFGHIGDNHLHVNILPRSAAEFGQGKELYRRWARAVVDWGGTVSAEHGIGKLKREFLEIMYGAGGVAQMRDVKRVFDPRWLLNPGTLFVP